MNDTVLGQTLEELRSLATSARPWVMLGAFGGLTGLVGPFGTYTDLTFAPRVLYWLVVVVTTFWIGYGVSFAVAVFAERGRLEGRIGTFIGALAAALPVTLLLAALHMLVFDAVLVDDAGRLLPYVLAITLGLAVMAELLAMKSTRPASPMPPAPAQASPAWLDQLPRHLGRDLILLQAQDHYLRVQTAIGETLLRERMQDAADALGDYGLRVHRSWWVARRAIKGVARRNGVPVVVLHNGMQVPVGRTYRRALRAALEARD